MLWLVKNKYVTASAVYPVLKHVKKKLTVDDTRDTAMAIQIKQTIWTDLEKRYTDTVVIEVLGITSFLDPHSRIDIYMIKRNHGMRNRTMLTILLNCNV